MARLAFGFHLKLTFLDHITSWFWIKISLWHLISPMYACWAIPISGCNYVRYSMGILSARLFYKGARRLYNTLLLINQSPCLCSNWKSVICWNKWYMLVGYLRWRVSMCSCVCHQTYPLKPWQQEALYIGQPTPLLRLKKTHTSNLLDNLELPL